MEKLHYTYSSHARRVLAEWKATTEINIEAITVEMLFDAVELNRPEPEERSPAKWLSFFLLYKVGTCLLGWNSGGIPVIVHHVFHDEDRDRIKCGMCSPDKYFGLSSPMSFELEREELEELGECIMKLKNAALKRNPDLERRLNASPRCAEGAPGVFRGMLQPGQREGELDESLDRQMAVYQ